MSKVPCLARVRFKVPASCLEQTDTSVMTVCREGQSKISAKQPEQDGTLEDDDSFMEKLYAATPLAESHDTKVHPGRSIAAQNKKGPVRSTRTHDTLKQSADEEAKKAIQSAILAQSGDRHAQGQVKNDRTAASQQPSSYKREVVHGQAELHPQSNVKGVIVSQDLGAQNKPVQHAEHPEDPRRRSMLSSLPMDPRRISVPQQPFCPPLHMQTEVTKLPIDPRQRLPEYSARPVDPRLRPVEQPVMPTDPRLRPGESAERPLNPLQVPIQPASSSLPPPVLQQVQPIQPDSNHPGLAWNNAYMQLSGLVSNDLGSSMPMNQPANGPVIQLQHRQGTSSFQESELQPSIQQPNPLSINQHEGGHQRALPTSVTVPHLERQHRHSTSRGRPRNGLPKSKQLGRQKILKGKKPQQASRPALQNEALGKPVVKEPVSDSESGELSQDSKEAGEARSAILYDAIRADIMGQSDDSISKQDQKDSLTRSSSSAKEDSIALTKSSEEEERRTLIREKPAQDRPPMGMVQYPALPVLMLNPLLRPAWPNAGIPKPRPPPGSPGRKLPASNSSFKPRPPSEIPAGSQSPEQATEKKNHGKSNGETMSGPPQSHPQKVPGPRPPPGDPPSPTAPSKKAKSAAFKPKFRPKHSGSSKAWGKQPSAPTEQTFVVTQPQSSALPVGKFKRR